MPEQVQKQHATIAGQAAEIEALHQTVMALAARLQKLEAVAAGDR